MYQWNGKMLRYFPCNEKCAEFTLRMDYIRIPFIYGFKYFSTGACPDPGPMIDTFCRYTAKIICIVFNATFSIHGKCQKSNLVATLFKFHFKVSHTCDDTINSFKVPV